MKTFRVAMLTALVVAGLTACATSQDAKPGVMVVEVVEWSGTVTAVDYTRGTVTLSEVSGKTVTLNAKHARNLNQVKVGDKVKAEYVEELAIFVRKADSPPSAEEAQLVELAPKGQKPAGLIADTVQITANVEAIDYQKRTITLKGPAGNVRTFKVDQSVKNFDHIKKGDQVVLRYTEAFALAVVKP